MPMHTQAHACRYIHKKERNIYTCTHRHTHLHKRTHTNIHIQANPHTHASDTLEDKKEESKMPRATAFPREEPMAVKPGEKMADRVSLATETLMTPQLTQLGEVQWP